MSAAPNPIPQDNKSSSEDALFQLTVTTADPSAEVFVINSDLSLAAPRGLGTLNIPLPPGIYKVRVRTGFVSTDKFVVLRDRPQTVSFGALQFVSPLPLPNTANTHEYHEAAASDESKAIHVRAGEGSSIFVFAREWTKPGAPPASEPTLNPAAGLTLKRLDGSVIADIENKSTKFSVNFPGDPWAACTIKLDPGEYLLSIKTVEGEYQQTVMAPHNWHARVFLTLRDYHGDKRQERRADLGGAAITLSTRQEFLPNAEDARLVELARLGLAQGRKVLSPGVLGEILNGKFNDPMLGIFGGHLLLMEDQVDLRLLGIVVGNLRKMLGSEHPDVEALASKLNGPGTAAPVRVPPMLKRSWQLVLEGTADQRCMVVRGSLAAQIFNRTCSGEPWLLWAGADSTNHITESDIEETLMQHIFGRSRDTVRDQPGRSSFTAPAQDIYKVSGIEQMEFASATVGEGAGAKAESGAAAGWQTDVEQQQADRTVLISKEGMGELIRDMGVPRFYMEDLLKKLNVRLLEM